MLQQETILDGFVCPKLSPKPKPLTPKPTLKDLDLTLSRPKPSSLRRLAKGAGGMPGQSDPPIRTYNLRVWVRRKQRKGLLLHYENVGFERAKGLAVQGSGCEVGRLEVHE